MDLWSKVFYKPDFTADVYAECRQRAWNDFYSFKSAHRAADIYDGFYENAQRK